MAESDGDTELRPVRRGSIRRRVALSLVAVALVPLLLIAFIAYRSQRNAAEQDAIERLTGILVVQEARVEAFATSSLENLAQITSRTQLRRSLRDELRSSAPENTELMNRILADAVAASATTDRIEVVSRDGMVVASSDGVGIGENRADDPVFRDGSTEPDISHVELTPSGTIGRHSAPVSLDGEKLGVALVTVRLDPLRELTSDYTGLGETGESALIGRTGEDRFELIAPLRQPAAYDGQAIVSSDDSDPTLGRGVALLDGRFDQATDYRNETVIAASSPIDAVDGWGLIVKIDRDEALRDAGRLGNLLLVSVLAAAALVTAAAAALARTLSKPVVELRDTAVAVSHGDTTRRAQVRGNDELTTLATEFNRMTDELTEANARLMRTNEQLEEFVYISSHDLKSPLRSIASFGQLLDQQYGSQLDHTGREYLRFIRDGAIRMHAVIEDLLTFLRIEKEGYQAEPVALNAVLNSVITLHRPAIGEAEANIDVGPLPTVLGSEPLIRQLFDNLLQNAIRYRHPDRSLRVRVRGTVDGDDAVVEVSDNGLGVPPDRREEAFEVFRRLSADGDGTGMGLAICRRIARRAGGDVTMEASDLAPGDEGVTAVVRLPAGDPAGSFVNATED